MVTPTTGWGGMVMGPLLGFVAALAGCGSGAGARAPSHDHHKPSCVSPRAVIQTHITAASTMRVGVGHIVPIWLIEPEAYASGRPRTPPSSAFPWLAPASSDGSGLTPIAVCKSRPLVFSLSARLYAFRAIRPGRYEITAARNPAYHAPRLRTRLPPLPTVRLTVVVATGGAPRPSANPTYALVAPVLRLAGDGRPTACLAFLLSLPPAGCGGVPVTGYDFRHIPGTVHFHNRGWQTRPLHLLGTWNGRVLKLTRPPIPVGRASPAPTPPATCHTTPTSDALARRLTDDHIRINMLSLLPCGANVWVLVAVADHETVSYIHKRYGRSVIVSGWLHRVPPH